MVTFHAEIKPDDCDEDEDDNYTMWVFPCLWILVSGGKTQQVYEEMFSEIAHLGNFSPEFIMCDYEKGLRNVATIFFPLCMVSGCLFHFINAVKRRVCRKHKKAYEHITYTDGVPQYSPTKLLVRRLQGLAYVPPSDVEACFVQVIANVSPDLQISLADEIDYFNKTWVSGVTVGQTTITPAIHPPVSWNVRFRTLAKMNRTNNPCESFHSKFSIFVPGNGKPTVWNFLDSMKKFQADTNNAIASMHQGNKPSRRKAREVKKNKRIFAATKEYHRMDLIPYLDWIMDL